MTELKPRSPCRAPAGDQPAPRSAGSDRASRNLPDFNPAATDALVSLGKASVVGKRAARKGQRRDQDPRRVVEEVVLGRRPALQLPARHRRSQPRRRGRHPGRTPTPGARGRRATRGWRASSTTSTTRRVRSTSSTRSATSFTSRSSRSGPGPAPTTTPAITTPTGPARRGASQVGVPNADGSAAMTNILEANRCVAWLGRNQPGSTSRPTCRRMTSVCPQGSADLSLCDPNGPTTTSFGDGSDGSRNLSFGDAGAAGGDGDPCRRRGQGGSDPGSGDDLLLLWPDPGGTCSGIDAARGQPRHAGIPRDRGTRPGDILAPITGGPSHRCRRGQRRPPRIPVRT